jgi:hypothetical protein
MMINFGTDISLVEAQRGGFRRPPPGGYVLVCTDVSLETTKKLPPRPMLKLSLDIVDGEYANAFTEFPLTYYVMLDEKSLGRAKGIFLAFQESNTNFAPISGTQFDESCLRGLCVGGVLFDEEYKPGKIASRIKYLTSVQEIKSGDFFVPATKPYEEDLPF